MVNLLSTWLDHGVSRYLAKHIWICLWEWFWMRLAFELADWVKQMTSPNVGGYHPIYWGPTGTKRQRKAEFFLFAWLLSWAISLLHLYWDLYHWCPRFSDLRTCTGIDRTSFSGSPACRQHTMGFLKPHNHVSQPLIIHLFVDTYIETET